MLHFRMHETEGTDKIFCANCAHCKVVRDSNHAALDVVLRVRCAAGMWKKRVGVDKLYRLDTVEQRRVPECLHYDPMGECQDFIRELRRSLPQTQELARSANT